MARMTKYLILTVGLGVFMVLTASTRAQGPGGNFDPAQMQQMMLDRIREQLEVPNDDEWKVIQERVRTVMQERISTALGGMRLGGFGRRNASTSNGNNAGGDGGGQRGGFRGGFGGLFTPEPNPAADDLQKAMDAKASPEELKAKIAKVREANKAKQAKLEKAQDDLRQVLSVRQEAAATLLGLLQ